MEFAKSNQSHTIQWIGICLEKLERLSMNIFDTYIYCYWLKVYIIQGVKIGSHTRIAPGAFVYKKTKDYFLYMGNPAKKNNL